MAEDAAVYQLDDETAIVQTVDFFPPVVDDPWTYGAIAAANAVSDVYAMGGEVLLALNIAAFPEDLPGDIVSEIFRGGGEKIAEAGGVVAGGHTVFDREPKYGLAVTGRVHPKQVLTKAGVRAGDALVLGKALGTGIVLTAAKQDAARPEHLDAAVQSMLRLNRRASHLARDAGVHAMTDVTGFAVVGHALEMAEASGLEVVLRADALPLLPGALDYARAGISTGGGGRNRNELGDRVRLPTAVSPEMELLLFDPQTSGGLLIAVDASAADGLVSALRSEGYNAAVIGEARSGTGVSVE